MEKMIQCPRDGESAVVSLTERTEKVVDCSEWTYDACKGECGGECAQGRFPRFARDLMQKRVIAVSDELGIEELAHLLQSKEISGAPVIDKSNRLVGVVSRSDLAANTGRESLIPRFHYDFDEVLDGFIVENLASGTRVSDIMTPAVYCIDEKATLRECIDMMLKARVHRLIVTRKKKLAGILSMTDLVRAMAELLP